MRLLGRKAQIVPMIERTVEMTITVEANSLSLAVISELNNFR
jgi:hypothetical protein